MFFGASSLSLDAKGRLSVPTRHQEALMASCEGQVTITQHYEGCLMVFPRPAWEAFSAKITALPMSSMSLKRLYLSNAMSVELDSTGRILISPELREAVMASSIRHVLQVVQASGRHSECLLDLPPLES